MNEGQPQATILWKTSLSSGSHQGAAREITVSPIAAHCEKQAPMETRRVGQLSEKLRHTAVEAGQTCHAKMPPESF